MDMSWKEIWEKKGDISKDSFDLQDLLKCDGWDTGAGYFPAFYPQYTPMARACGGAVVVLSAVAVAAITLLYPAKRHYAPPESE